MILQRKYSKVWALVLCCACLFLLTAVGSLAAGSNTITKVIINGTSYDRNQINGETIDQDFVQNLEYTLRANIDVAGYDSYRISLAIQDPGTGNLSTERDISGSSITFSPYTFSAANRDYNIELVLYGMKGNNKTLLDTVSFTLAIGAMDTAAPRISSQSPAGGAKNVSVNDVVEVTFNEKIDPNTVTSSNIYISGKSASISLSNDQRTITLTPGSRFSYNTSYNVNIRENGLKDLAGNGISAATWSFTTGSDPSSNPTIEERLPASGAKDVPVTTDIVITLSKPLDVNTVTGGAVTLKKGSSTIPATIVPRSSNSAGQGTITIDPISSLELGTQYTVAVSGNTIKDTSGKTLGASSWSFTTTAGSAPTVQSQYPASGGKNIPLNATVTFKFSKAMNSGTINGNNIYLTRAGSSSKISADLNYNSSTRTVSLDPRSDLARSTSYTVYVTSGAKDSSGNGVSATNWSFTTGSANSVTISSKNPAPNAKNVPVESTVSFKFSRAMNTSSIDSDSIYLRRSGSNTAVKADVSYNSSTRVVTLTPRNELDYDETYTVYVTSDVRDSDRDYIAAEQWSFDTISEDDLHIRDRDPEPGEDDFPVDKEITIKFSQKLRSSSITGSTVYLRKAGSSTNINATLSYSNSSRTVTLTPKSNLASDTDYRIYLTNGIRDEDGNRLSATNWIFTTEKETLAAGSFVPSSGAQNVAVGQSIRATFSQAMRANTIDSSSVYLRETRSGQSVPADVSYNSTNRTVTLNPKNNLKFDTQYTVYITDKAKGSNGISVKAVNWSFTTVRLQGTSARPLVLVNGNNVEFTDAYPYLKNGRVMIPFRALFESLNATVDYQQTEKKVTAKLGNNTVVLYVGRSTAYRNGKAITLDVPPVSIDGRVMIPLRFAGESLGADVRWDNNVKTVFINTK
ncbi:Ig-like domain-containing protein [Dehalobacterium formicoaceticum]|nr:Ig-like domain-containing protein [Dehalobacterium formicoaceticum]